MRQITAIHARRLIWLRLFAVALLLVSCSPSPNTSTGNWMLIHMSADSNGAGAVMDRRVELAQTSLIPGATARVFAPAAPPASTSPASTSNALFCVTSAGYCPLAAATPSGENCLCATGNLMYGGKTGAAPQPLSMSGVAGAQPQNLPNP